MRKNKILVKKNYKVKSMHFLVNKFIFIVNDLFLMWGEGIKILKLIIILRVLQILGFTFWWKKSHMEKLAIGTKKYNLFH